MVALYSKGKARQNRIELRRRSQQRQQQGQQQQSSRTSNGIRSKTRKRQQLSSREIHPSTCNCSIFCSPTSSSVMMMFGGNRSLNPTQRGSLPVALCIPAYARSPLHDLPLPVPINHHGLC